ncbi:MAG: glycosyltransferase family 1 protein [Spirochaetaceae bacterium]|jgi:glycosyltransferase involved in cell wall biosynthesis|nr:glycosyltransferase family 1 protein [Spirochaetaceae bacterium]
MRIAYFTDTFTPELNGVTNTLSRLRSWLDKKDMRYAFFAPAYAMKPNDAVFPNQQGRLIHRFRGLAAPFSPESCLAFPPHKEIFALCDDFKPDLVHVVTELGMGSRGLRYARSRNLPLVMSYHTDYCNYLRYFHLDFLRPLVEKYLARFYRFAHRVLAPSRHTLEQLLQKRYRNLGLWSRGIDTESFHPRFRNRAWRKSLGIDGKFVFLYVGRLSPEKGLDMLLHAIEEIERRFPGKAAFVFTGGGPFADNIRRKQYSNVILTGFRTGRELSEIYASCDCFAFPSGTETFGNAPLEATASALPVVGVASGGVTEFLSHGENALLCAGGDRHAFTGNLSAVMNNSTLRRELSERGLLLARFRSWDLVFDNLISIYGELISDRRDAPESYRDAS